LSYSAVIKEYKLTRQQQAKNHAYLIMTVFVPSRFSCQRANMTA
jgi:hypothetical protein